MNESRDRFLTEAMGEFCYHDYRHEPCHTNPYICIKCCYRHGFPLNNDFSTWTDFGKLFEWAKEQDWWNHEFAYVRFCPDLVHPDRFADAVYSFLKERAS